MKGRKSTNISNVGSDVGISTLNVDQDKLYVRGQWETSNPSLQSMLLLHQRFTEHHKTKQLSQMQQNRTKNDSVITSHLKKEQNVNMHQPVQPRKKKKREFSREQSASELWLERQRDSTVIAQSIAQSKPNNVSSLPTIASAPVTPYGHGSRQASNNNDTNVLKPKSARVGLNGHHHVPDSSNEVSLPAGVSVYDMMQFDDQKEFQESMDIMNVAINDSLPMETTELKQETSYSLGAKKIGRKQNTISVTAPSNNIINNDMSTYIKTDDEHFVSVSNESYLSELFLKQPVIMKLKYVSIGPFHSGEWNNKSIYWKVEICMKRDFDYFDDMKYYQFTYYQIEQTEFYRMKFNASDNLKNTQQTSLSLNGNICIKIYRCKREGVIINDKKLKDEFGDDNEKMIGSIWIHSHFIPANYDRKIDIMTFRKNEIDGMYKDKKNKTSIPGDFTVEIGYRCSRIKADESNENISNLKLDKPDIHKNHGNIQNMQDKVYQGRVTHITEVTEEDYFADNNNNNNINHNNDNNDTSDDNIIGVMSNLSSIKTAQV